MISELGSMTNSVRNGGAKRKNNIFMQIEQHGDGQ